MCKKKDPTSVETCQAHDGKIYYSIILKKIVKILLP